MRLLIRLLPFYLYAAGMTWVVRHDPFFWDTVQLASKHAHFFYQHHLQWDVLPANIDSGHPPLLGYYLACIWTYVGYTLPVSHFSILPFLCLLIWSLYRLGLRLGGQAWAFWLIPLVLLDPVVAGQSVLVSPDIILLSFFLLSLEGILGNQKIYILLGVLGLCMVSMRGMMCVAGLGVFMTLLALKNKQSWQNWSIQALSFVPGVLAAFAFLYGHWQAVGWIGYHAGSEWAPAFHRADAWGIVRNIAVLGWRWLDFGRVFEWILLLILGIRILRNHAQKPLFALILLMACMCFFLSISAVLYQNLSAHRYFLPAYCCLHLLVFQRLIVSNLKESFIRLTFVALITALAAGNFWVYPRGISMDWDATLAHQPYHALRAQAISYLDQEGIDYQQVGTAFPNLNSGVDLMLNDDIRRFSVIHYDQNQLIFVSNITNDVELSDYHRLEADWVRVRRFEQAGVWIELYRRKNQ